MVLKNKIVNKYFGFIIIFVLSIIVSVPFFMPGFPITHDGSDHIARIANFYASLSDGVLVPRWAGNLNWGYGHPILMFLYPLPSYSASLFHFLGFNFQDSVKIVFALSFLLSGIFMYLWAGELFGETSGLVTAILYMFAPYRFVDFYVRGAIGECAAFVFPPLVMYFLLKLAKDKNYQSLNLSLSAIAFAGLILAHNAISLMFIPLIFLYVIYLSYCYKSPKLFIYSILSLALGFLLSMFFWLPAYVEGKYTLRDIVTGDGALLNFISIPKLIFGRWGYGSPIPVSYQLGIFQWASILAFPIFVVKFVKKEGENIHFYLIMFVYFLGSIFIMLPESKVVWTTITTLEKFQFPWRFLSVSVFCSSVLGGFVVSVMNKKYQKYLLVFLIIGELLVSRNYIFPRGYFHLPDSHFTGIYNGTTDTGESAPIWSVRFMEHRPAAPAEVIGGKAKIVELSRNTVQHNYEITAITNSQIRENTLYFPGWKVYVDGRQDSDIQFQDAHSRGLITYRLTEGKHAVKIVFENTRLRTVSEFTSLIVAIIIAILLAYLFLRPKKYAKA